MQWSSVSEFFAMGGYGLYVWGAYAVTALVLAAEGVALAWRGKTLRDAAGRSSHAQAD